VGETSIQWTDYTFNPWWGCTRDSPGCERCYAETFAHRLGMDLWGPTAGRRFFEDKHWNEPLKWARRRAGGDTRHRVFCASMADVFEDLRALDSQRARLWDLIAITPELTWQLLTKRPENIDKLAPGAWTMGRWPANVWMLVTAEDQERADLRIPILLRTGARVRGVSVEPMLGPVDLHMHILDGWSLVPPLDQVIVGGESGPGARPFDLAWARSVMRQCREAGVAFFMKQMGARPYDGGEYCGELNPHFGARGLTLKSKKGGDPSEWPEDLRVREFPR
jgi:protein gp37